MPAKITVTDNPAVLSDEIVGEIMSFFERVDPFYEGVDIPELKIGGTWRNDLMTRRGTQLRLIASRDREGYRILQERMFFNELVFGLWTYGYYKEGIVAPDDFLAACNRFQNLTGTPVSQYASPPVQASWGLAADEHRVVRFTDPDQCTQAFNILNLVAALHAKRKVTVADLGSGFGGMAEKLALMASQPLNIILIDIPMNLVTAYGFLARIYGMDRVKLVSRREEVASITESSAFQGPDFAFFLIPSLFIESISQNVSIDILNNSASLSEMDFHTIRYYLETLVTDRLEFFIETNSNVPADNCGHLEVASSSFPVPSSHALLGRFWYTGRYFLSLYGKLAAAGGYTNESDELQTMIAQKGGVRVEA